ncbi:hypothetical protein [uncultured Hyphomicrobium sp.]|jgi:hypothetical protein|uniref:hypothetical protein n=2 Tax=Hyphomicrobium TaxID=81 RepID=UPI00035FA7C8|nr:hypothetical protein [uncultured Hyphomicrobium sp.]
MRIVGLVPLLAVGLMAWTVDTASAGRVKDTFRKVATPDPPKVPPAPPAPPPQKAIDNAAEQNAKKSLDDAAGAASRGKVVTPKVDIPADVSPQARDKLLQSKESIRRQGASNKSLEEIRSRNKAAEEKRLRERQEFKEKTPIAAAPQEQKLAAPPVEKASDKAIRPKREIKQEFNREAGATLSGRKRGGGSASEDGPKP